MQKYPRGSRGSPAKGVVWETVARVRISSSAPKTRRWIFHFRVFYCNFRRDSRVGAVLREQNALPYGGWIIVKPTAKDDVDNVGAGRAAKGETLGLTQNCSLRSGTLTPTYRRSLISSLKSVVNAFLNGQLVLLQPSTLPPP